MSTGSGQRSPSHSYNTLLAVPYSTRQKNPNSCEGCQNSRYAELFEVCRTIEEFRSCRVPLELYRREETFHRNQDEVLHEIWSSKTDTQIQARKNMSSPRKVMIRLNGKRLKCSKKLQNKCAVQRQNLSGNIYRSEWGWKPSHHYLQRCSKLYIKNNHPEYRSIVHTFWTKAKFEARNSEMKALESVAICSFIKTIVDRSRRSRSTFSPTVYKHGYQEMKEKKPKQSIK